jgi:ferredoxin
MPRGSDQARYNITEKKDAPPDAKEFDGVTEKFEKYFSEAPGEGD